MYLRDLRLTQFKNYQSAAFAFSATVNLVVGLNGSGKTNLLDSIYCLCACKSYFNHSDSQNIQHQAQFFRLEGNFLLNPNAPTDTENIVFTYTSAKKKDFLRNQTAYEKLSEHIGLLPVVMIAPDDVELIKEGSEPRRKMLDTTLSQLDRDYLNALIKYNRLLLNRNALLKQFAERNEFNATLLDTYTVQMIPLGNQIHQKRQAFCHELTPILQQYYECLSNGSEEVNCTYKSGLNDTDFAQILQQNIATDRQQQRTTEGIHRDDLVFSISQYPLKKYGSQGQQKSFLIALKLAIYELIAQHTQIKPILLLDDIFDKLDEQRIEQLLQVTACQPQKFGQIFISDTQQARITAICAKFGIENKTFLMVNCKL